MDWKEQLQNDINDIIRLNLPPTDSNNTTITAPQNQNQNDANSDLIDIGMQLAKLKPQPAFQPPNTEPAAHKVLRDLVPKFQKLNEMFCQAYERNDLTVAEDLRKRLNWAISEFEER